MSRVQRLIHEIHRRSLWQVLAIYLATAWLVFEAVQALTEGLRLPEWVPGVAFALLLVGLPIVLGTALVREGLPRQADAPGNTQAPGPGGGSGDLDLSTLLTWRNAIVSGMAALAIAGLVAAGLILGAGPAGDAPAARITSLAVLPLANLTGDPAQAFFVEGMQDALIAELARIESLKVISRTSTLRYRETDRTAPQIASELGAEGLIEGSVLRDGDDVRITVQLIHGPTDRHIWARSYEREMAGILALQREVVGAIAAEIHAAVGREPDPTGAPSVDPEAYEAYLKGVQRWNRATGRDWQECVEHLERSTTLDPDFAPAFAYLSLCHTLQGYYTDVSPSLLHSRARAAAGRAIALDPDLAEAHAAMAFVHVVYDWNWEGAERASARAVHLSPNASLVLQGRGLILTLLGRHDEAIAVGRRATALDPLSPFVQTRMAWYHYFARDYASALRHVANALDLDPDYPDAYVIASWTYAALGEFEKARQANATILPPWGAHRKAREPSAVDRAWLKGLEAGPDAARAVLDSFPAPPSVGPHAAFWWAMAYAAAGDHDRAFELLDRTYHGRGAMMSTLKVDPRADVFRDDPRFDSLLARVAFPD